MSFFFIFFVYSRYIEDMYPPPPEMYDPMYDYRYNGQYNQYMSRQPYPSYNRYDIPDYNDYPPSYGNEIENRYFSREIPSSPQSDYPRRRMIYYAYLPEVVRSPQTVDLRYRSYNRIDKYDPYAYDPYFDRYDPYVGQSR